MTDSELIAAADQVLRGDDQESAAALALQIHEAMFRLMAEVYARQLLQGEVKPTTVAVSPELLSMLAPKAPEITVDLIQHAQPKRKKRTVVTKHDERGRIVEFEQEDVQ
jgi:hypothetical protein